MPKAGIGHYYAADPGSVDLNVWVFRASGQMLRHVRGSVEYALGDADWRSSRDATAIAMVSLVGRTTRKGVVARSDDDHRSQQS